jgi:hypothetical protein
MLLSQHPQSNKQQQSLQQLGHANDGSSSPFAAKHALLEQQTPSATELEDAGCKFAAGAPDGVSDLAASTASTTPADSRLTSRQSSARALLPADGMQRSSSQHMSSGSAGPRGTSVEMTAVVGDAGPVPAGKAAAAASPAVPWGFGLLTSRSRRATAEPASGHRTTKHSRPGHADAVTFEESQQADDADASLAGVACRSARSTKDSIGSGTSFLRRWNSKGWQRLGRQGSEGAAGSAEQQAQLQREWQQQQLQRRQQAAAEAAAAAAAAEKLGADVEWWAFKTGDPLLDRHVVDVDVAGDLAWAGAAGEHVIFNSLYVLIVQTHSSWHAVGLV